MKSNPNTQRAARGGFTLIELLVVISIMGILAALIFPVSTAVNKHKTIKLVQSKLGQVETAIDAYKQKKGFYPPDNALTPQIPGLNPLFYELTGTVYNPATSVFQTIKGNETISSANIGIYFGLGGFVNSSTDPNEVQDFYPTLRSADFAQVTTNTPYVEVLVVSVPGPGLSTLNLPPVKQEPPPGPTLINGQINPWRYVSSNPTNNPSSYDLWVDIVIGGKAYRISNWSKDPIGL